MFKDYYKQLNIARTASAEEIKQSYREMAKKYHPDSNPDPKAKFTFVEINEAHQTLGDERKRARYNLKYDYYLQKGKPPPVIYHTYQRAKHSYQSRPKKEEIPAFWKKSAAYTKACLWLNIAVFALLFTDLLLKPIAERHRVEKVIFNYDSFWIETDKTAFLLDYQFAGILGKDMEIDLYYTPIFHQLQNLRIFPDLKAKEVQPLFPKNDIIFRPTQNVYTYTLWIILGVNIFIFFIPKTDEVFETLGNVSIGFFSLLLLFIAMAS